jgi:hypothetical protein
MARRRASFMRRLVSFWIERAFRISPARGHAYLLPRKI